jgi:hypothetical protein
VPNLRLSLAVVFGLVNFGRLKSTEINRNRPPQPDKDSSNIRFSFPKQKKISPRSRNKSMHFA